MTIIIHRRFTAEQAKKVYQQIVLWFKDNPKRRVCYTDIFKVRRKHIVEDILFHCEDTVRPYDLVS